jgi:hypothetical protein
VAKERVAVTVGVAGGPEVTVEASTPGFEALLAAIDTRTPLSAPDRLAMAVAGRPGELGPMVAVVWHLGVEGSPAPGLVVREELYPDAYGGPLLRAFPIEGEGPGAWFEVDASVVDVVAALGVQTVGRGGSPGPESIIVVAVFAALIGGLAWNRRDRGGVRKGEGGTLS